MGSRRCRTPGRARCLRSRNSLSSREFAGRIISDGLVMEGAMNVSVLLEPVPGNGFRASAASPFDISEHGATKEEALNKFQESLTGRLKQGATIVTIEVPCEHTWLPFAGMFK